MSLDIQVSSFLKLSSNILNPWGMCICMRQNWSTIMSNRCACFAAKKGGQ